MSTDITADVEKAQNGDTEAFARLYSLVYKELYHISLTSLNNEYDASDVVSDTVMDAYRTITQLRDPKAFKSWIITILSAKIKKKQKEYVTEREMKADIDECSETESLADQSEERGKSDVMRCFEQLDDDDRHILSLSVISGYKSREIAVMIGEKESTVRSRIMRAKQRLKQLYEQK